MMLKPRLSGLRLAKRLATVSFGLSEAERVKDAGGVGGGEGRGRGAPNYHSYNKNMVFIIVMCQCII